MPNLAFSLMKKQKCQHKGPRLVKTWFNQPGRAARRHQARVVKAKKIFPRPIHALRPLVNCCGISHNLYTRLGKGFSISELTAVKLNPNRARQMGIAVDYRRVNKSQHALDRNVTRLQEYLGKVVIFDKTAKPEDIKKAVQVSVPLEPKKIQPVILTAKVADQPKMDVYKTLHDIRMNSLVSRKTRIVKAKRAVATKKK